ncbi:Acetyltransferase (GNAT) domain-containing protein [Chitinophaga rupis]|uniref:Acetyltransferase (GNAT) domain-containing protein n=1 Tax=Chitinophaga rupis TaxID=573321 RepID=A0A1H8ISW2_9BACT|nr:GNAT family N-acetyltransferase [Chitinophaga rupis]SEN71481.1 Acetyltransferase (GNAT) domain-containing protein [Chitinophaga rupis]
MENIVYKTIGDQYSNDVIQLILPIQQIEFGVRVTLEDQPDLKAINAFYRETGGNFWGAFDGNTLVGTIALINIGHQAGAIRKMFVKKEYRGKEFGIAQQLLAKLLAYSREQGIKDIYLGTVEQLKAAQRFYEKNQFTLIQKTDLPDYFPVMSSDSMFFHLQLK